MDATFLKALERVAAVKRDEPLSRHTTIGIGGPADAFVTVETAPQMIDVLTLARDAGEPVFVLGSGSNIVVGDRGIRGITIDNKAQTLTPMLHPSGWSAETQTNGAERPVFRAEAGASFAATARQLAFAGLAGLEWACGIPGTVGGAVVYNAGAYGGCLADVLTRVGVWDPAAGEVEYAADDLGLVYRGSAFTRGLMAGRAVLWAEFALWPGDAAELRARVADYDARRLNAQPRGRNAGSFFKNPPGQPAWRLLEAVGLRGGSVGGAQFSPKHCNFLVNTGNATAADVAALKRLAQDRVRDQFGLELENEVSLVGEGFGDTPNPLSLEGEG
ncbi:MAG TPA: UDP-N-acetylmuramate dehydrogenase [Dehalococcoidia bacterium]|nr:UDP-N-acetylmuramate dehydrogenase [Dehalococcoidia bacterium]